MTKLVIMSGSRNVKAQPAVPIPALYRLDGSFMKQLRKYYDRLDNVDVLILSQTYGLISAEEKIGIKAPTGGTWHNLKFEDDDVRRSKKLNIKKLSRIFSQKDYDEVYLNVGERMRGMIEGFEEVVPDKTTITYCRGGGMGPKMANTRDWFESNLKPDLD